MTMKMSKISVLFAAACGFFAIAQQAHAHKITDGYVNAGPGSVTFWMGSYHQDGIGDGPDIEGSLTLVGINGNPFASTTVSYTLSTTSQPVGLINGVNNFFDPAANFTGYTFASVNSWQGVTFTGLSAGDYQFSFNPGASAHWSSFGSNSHDITLTAEVVNGVPDGSSTVAMLGLALFGLVGMSRKFGAQKA